MIRILIADDHPVVRRGLKQILSDDADMVVADEASNGQEVLEKSRDGDFNVILLDIAMPSTDVLEVMRHLRKERPELAILILSIYPEEQYALRMFRAGASGYLQKESTPDELIAAIRKVSAGGRYVSNSLAERLASGLEFHTQKLPHENLSDREFTVMYRLVHGKRLKEIADELSLSPKTVSTYRRRILNKMKMKSNYELAGYAREHRLVP